VLLLDLSNPSALLISLYKWIESIVQVSVKKPSLVICGTKVDLVSQTVLDEYKSIISTLEKEVQDGISIHNSLTYERTPVATIIKSLFPRLVFLSLKKLYMSEHSRFQYPSYYITCDASLYALNNIAERPTQVIRHFKRLFQTISVHSLQPLSCIYKSDPLISSRVAYNDSFLSIVARSIHAFDSNGDGYLSLSDFDQLLQYVNTYGDQASYLRGSEEILSIFENLLSERPMEMDSVKMKDSIVINSLHVADYFSSRAELGELYSFLRMLGAEITHTATSSSLSLLLPSSHRFFDISGRSSHPLDPSSSFFVSGFSSLKPTDSPQEIMFNDRLSPILRFLSRVYISSISNSEVARLSLEDVGRIFFGYEPMQQGGKPQRSSSHPFSDIFPHNVPLDNGDFLSVYNWISLFNLLAVTRPAEALRAFHFLGYITHEVKDGVITSSMDPRSALEQDLPRKTTSFVPSRVRRVFLLGAKGSGKSSMIQYLMHSNGLISGKRDSLRKSVENEPQHYILPFDAPVREKTIAKLQEDAVALPSFVVCTETNEYDANFILGEEAKAQADVIVFVVRVKSESSIAFSKKWIHKVSPKCPTIILFNYEGEIDAKSPLISQLELEFVAMGVSVLHTNLSMDTSDEILARLLEMSLTPSLNNPKNELWKESMNQNESMMYWMIAAASVSCVVLVIMYYRYSHSRAIRRK
jgi:hypothetical protein